MFNNRGTSVNKNRDAWVEINLGNLENNILKIKEHLAKKLAGSDEYGFESNKKTAEAPKLFAVIKADGYGHGSIMCAPTMSATGVDYFGVASIDEGIELRENKISKPILVLGASPLWAFENAVKYDIELSIFNFEHLEAAQQLYKRLHKKLKVHIKLDTGMNRIGISKNEAKNFIEKVKNFDFIDLKGIFTHFADVENKKLFERQLEEFREITAPYQNSGILLHCLNSPAIFMYPEYSYDMVRMGIIMWGLTPFSKEGAKEKSFMEGFLPVMGLKARITNIHTLKKGDGISYGHTFIAKKDTKVATIPIGYADGVARGLSGKITASLNGQAIKQIGRITMDQIMFDVTGIECSVGDIIVLLGEENKIDTIDTWAKKLNTINYELTCRLKMRLARIYVR